MAPATEKPKPQAPTFEYSTDNILWRVLFSEKKLTKKQIREIDTDAVISAAAGTQIVNFNIVRFVVLSVSKVISRKFRYLYEDCTAVLLALDRAAEGGAIRRHVPSSAPITLPLRNDNLFIGDDIFDLDDIMADQRQLLELPDSGIFMDDGFEASFAGLSNVEVARQGTLTESSLLLPQLPEAAAVKKRRVAEDGVTELPRNMLKIDSRSIAQPRTLCDDLAYRLRSLLEVDPLISSFLKQDQSPVPEIEQERAASVMMSDFNIGDFGDAFGDVDLQRSETSTDISTADRTAVLFDASTLPSSFEFGTLVSGYSKTEQALYFGMLLAMASTGELTATQAEPYGPIGCIIGG